MDQEFIYSTDEHIIETENENVLEVDVDIEDSEHIVETEETIEVVKVELEDELRIEVKEAVGWVGGDNTQHYGLTGRDEPDQHVITAITGLREELDSIEALQTLYSNEKQSADYYEWIDNNLVMENRTGYFVSLCEDVRAIKICTDGDVFGVTVDTAAFIGGQDDIARDIKYGLVVYSGVAHVRCELDIEVGDYVVSNSYGMAKKSNSDYGCKVIALHNIKDVIYATIIFDASLNQLNTLGEENDVLDSRMTEAEKNIAAAMNEANKANSRIENLKNEVTTFQDDTGKQSQEAIEMANSAIQTMEEYRQQISDAQTVSAQAKAISDAAVNSAEKIKSEAVETANNALAKVFETQEDIGELISEISPLSQWESEDGTKSGIVGFVARANADSATLATLAEWKEDEGDNQSIAGTIAKVNDHEAILNHITDHQGVNGSTIAEVEQKADDNGASITNLVASVDKYSVGEYSQAYGLTREQAQSILKPGYIYIPTANNYKCCETHEKVESHCETCLNGSEVNAFTPGNYYEWDGSDWIEYSSLVVFNSSPPANSNGTLKYWYLNSNTPMSGYEAYSLYVWEDSQWKKVNTLSGNVNNRATSMIRQAVDEVAIEITNTRKDIAALDIRLGESEAEIDSIARWTLDPDGNTYNLATIQQKAEDNGASIAQVVEAVGENGEVNAASIVTAINKSGSSVNINADHIVLEGLVTANGTFTIDKSGYMTTTGGTIGNLTLSNGKLFGLANATNAWVSGLNSTFLSNEGNTIFLWAGAKGGDGVSQESTRQTFGQYSWGNAKSIVENTANFYVTHTGDLYSKSGFIGGWNITDSYLGTPWGNNHNDRFFIASTPKWSTSNIYSNTKGCRLFFNGNFAVDEGGYLWATGATITGEITATSGKIGQWEIQNDYLGTSWGNNHNDRFFIASEPKWSTSNVYSGTKGTRLFFNGNFAVDQNGYLYATGATITGDLKAGTILQNGVKVGDNKNSYFDTIGSSTRWMVAEDPDKDYTLISLGPDGIDLSTTSGNINIKGNSCNISSSLGVFGNITMTYGRKIIYAYSDGEWGYIGEHWTKDDNDSYSKEHIQINSYHYIDLMIQGSKKTLV